MRSSGFSLVELLVTVVVVGILASMTMANFQLYREKAYNTENLINFNTLKVAAITVEQELKSLCVNCSSNFSDGCWRTGVVGVHQCSVVNLSKATMSNLIPEKMKNNPLLSFTVTARATQASVTLYRTSYNIESFHCLGNEMLFTQTFSGGDLDGIKSNITYFKSDPSWSSLWENRC